MYGIALLIQHKLVARELWFSPTVLLQWIKKWYNNMHQFTFVPFLAALSVGLSHSVAAAAGEGVAEGSNP